MVRAIGATVRGLLKVPAEYDRDISSTKFTDIFRQVSRCFATGCLLLFARELWLMNRELLERRWRRTIDQKWPKCMGRFVRYHPETVKCIIL
jgi:hypothetical protein